MEKNNARSAKHWTTTGITQMALVIGLYVAMTLVLLVFSFRVIRIRLSEMFNYLSLYNKRYIVAVAAGIALANITSPLGLIDVVVGSVSMLIVLLINYKITSHIKNMKIKMAVTACVSASSMFTIADQLAILYQLSFFLDWRAIVSGELASIIVGRIIICWISKKVGLTK